MTSWTGVGIECEGPRKRRDRPPTPAHSTARATHTHTHHHRHELHSGKRYRTQLLPGAPCSPTQKRAQARDLASHFRRQPREPASTLPRELAHVPRGKPPRLRGERRLALIGSRTASRAANNANWPTALLTPDTARVYETAHARRMRNRLITHARTHAYCRQRHALRRPRAHAHMFTTSPTTPPPPLLQMSSEVTLTRVGRSLRILRM